MTSLFEPPCTLDLMCVKFKLVTLSLLIQLVACCQQYEIHNFTAIVQFSHPTRAFDQSLRQTSFFTVYTVWS